MSPSRRAAVSAYLEVFLLIAVAAAGSAVVLAAGLRTVASYQGASISVTEGDIRQGAFLAIESLLVENTGNAPFRSFEVSTSGVSDAASYCYTLYDPASRSMLLTTCPAMSTDPGTVDVSATVPPGKGVLVELTVVGRAFSPGSVSTVIVTTSAGSQGSLGAVVVPA